MDTIIEKEIMIKVINRQIERLEQNYKNLVPNDLGDAHHYTTEQSRERAKRFWEGENGKLATKIREDQIPKLVERREEIYDDILNLALQK